MSYNASVYQILIASPSDVQEERQLVRELIINWNAVHSKSKGCMLTPVMWETHSTPEMGDEPQVILNRQLVDECDALIGIFWTRIGTPTSAAESGTVEEIECFIASGKPVMLYFSSRPVPPDQIDQEQLSDVRRIRWQYMKRGLINSYQSLDDLREMLTRNLVNLAEKLPGAASAGPEEQPDTTRDLIEISDNLRQNVIWFERDWHEERDSGPTSLDDAKRFLKQFGRNLRNFRQALEGSLSRGLLDRFDDLTLEITKLLRYEYHLDGGKSWNAFWKQGDRIARTAKSLATDVALESAANSAPGYSGPYQGYKADELRMVLREHLEKTDTELRDSSIGEFGDPGSYFSGKLIHYNRLDEELQLPSGTSRILLREVAEDHGLKVYKATHNTIQFE